MIDQMRTVVQNVPKDISPAARTLIEQESSPRPTPRFAHSRARRRGMRLQPAPSTVEYYRFAQALADPKGRRMSL